MCIFIYTLPQHCGHTFFQNVSECPIARGLAPTNENRLDATLKKTKFLFDTSRSRTRTPEAYSCQFDCKKSKAVRPVPSLCDNCITRNAKEKNQRSEAEALECQSRRIGDSLMVHSSHDGVVESESAGSAAALMGARLDASSTSSTLHDVSGMSFAESLIIANLCGCGRRAK